MNNDFYLQEKRYLRLKSVLELIPVSRSTWYKWIQLGLAPKPIHISLRVAAWKYQDIDNLLDEMAKPEWNDKIRGKQNAL